jgi:methyl-accepting chemotaxis protein
MLSLLKKRAPATARTDSESALPPDPAATDATVQRVVAGIARQASSLGKDAADVRGTIEDATKVATRQMQSLAAQSRQLHDISGAQSAIERQGDQSLRAVTHAREAVDAIGREVGSIVTTLQQVSAAAREITQVALQTRLVAFNASVEAKRAGEAGRGFGVVADAVKELAASVEASSKNIMGTVQALDTRIAALAQEIHRQPAGRPQGRFHSALSAVEEAVQQIHVATTQSVTVCAGLSSRMVEIEQEMQSTGSALNNALGSSEALLKISESLIETVAECGVVNDDTPFIQAAQGAAQEVAHLLEQALARGEIRADELFDEQYQPMAGTNPQQHTSRFVALADRLFPSVQERMLQFSPKVVFCIAVDRNGYVATHNRRYCQPQRGDLAWDTANSRYRRIFNDRTGLASARNQRPFLLQTYRRDMGGGTFVVLKEASAPIRVQGRAWGGLRLAYHF